jgi:hypothetical protein
MSSSILFGRRLRRIYVSGQISGIDLDDAKQNFISACVKLQDSYCADFTVNPFDVKPFLGLKIWICYMINDVRAQSKCNYSAFQRNWIESRGAVIEYFFAKFIFRHKIIFL